MGLWPVDNPSGGLGHYGGTGFAWREKWISGAGRSREINNDLVYIQLFTVYKALECDLSLAVFCMHSRKGTEDCCGAGGQARDVVIGAEEGPVSGS